MTSYLIYRDTAPFTAAEIRADIGLATSMFDPLIASAIENRCIRSVKPVRAEIWSVAEGSAPAREADSVGEPYQREGRDTRLFRDHTYAPDAAAVEEARLDVARWCLNQQDIGAALSRERRRAHEAAAPMGEVA